MDYAGTKDIIHRTAILSESDSAFIDQNIADIQSNWQKKQMFRTETEMRISVLNDTKFPTAASKYWQCIREQAVFYEQLVQLSFQYRRDKLKMAKLTKKIEARKAEDVADDFKLMGLEIDLEEVQFGLLNAEQVAKDRMREIKLWAGIMQECIDADPNFDSDNVDHHQFVSYMWRWHEQLKGLEASDSSISEVNNLIGQYATALRVAKEKQVILPLAIQKDAQRIGVPIFQPPSPSLESKQQGVIMNINDVKFELNGITSAIRES